MRGLSPILLLNILGPTVSLQSESEALNWGGDDTMR